MDALFQTIREAAESSTWSRGVELSRASAVTLEREDSDAITLRVTTGGGAASFTVQLYPEDEEWSCDCSSVEEVCEHVTGAGGRPHAGRGRCCRGVERLSAEALRR